MGREARKGWGGEGRGGDGEGGGKGSIRSNGFLETIAHDVTGVSDEIVGTHVDVGVVRGEVLVHVEQAGDLVVDGLLDALGRGVASVQRRDGGGDATVVEGVKGGEEGLDGLVHETEGGGELIRLGTVVLLDSLFEFKLMCSYLLLLTRERVGERAGEGLPSSWKTQRSTSRGRCRERWQRVRCRSSTCS